MRKPNENSVRVLVIDVGGSHVKYAATDHPSPARFKSGAKLTPQRMMKALSRLTGAGTSTRCPSAIPASCAAA
jgi:hypothetical protein